MFIRFGPYYFSQFLHNNSLTCTCRVFTRILFSCSVSGPRKVEQLEVVDVSSSQVWLRWLVHVGRHAGVSQVRVSLVPADGSGPRTAVLNSSVTEYTFRSVMTQNKISLHSLKRMIL